jgi:GAF domain-containing protein
VDGTFCFYDDEPRSEPFTDWEATLIDLLGNWASTGLERQRYTDRIAALNELNAAAMDAIDAVIDHSTREAIERTV